MDHFEQPAAAHDQLNPRLWEGNDIKKPVQIALLRIARAYWDFLGIETRLVDVVVSGSQANYNYSAHSDIDLHLIVDYDSVECDMDIDELFDTKRKLWKEQHDITVHEIPVEVYVEDLNKPAVSASFSLIKNQWIVEPEQRSQSVDPRHVERLCLSWIRVITAAIRSKNLDRCEQVKEMLWTYRKAGLAVQGEMGTANVVFKTLRNNGVTDSLLGSVRRLRDLKLSLENR